MPTPRNISGKVSMDAQGTSAAMAVASMASVPASGPTAASAASAIPSASASSGECRRCQVGGGDVQVMGCGCCLHARCFPISNPPIQQCPVCRTATQGIALVGMDFAEVDEARRAVLAAPPKKGRKRKSDKDQDPDHAAFGDPSDRRTGRWSAEEVAYCDILIDKFGTGELPVEEKTKLNEFLGNMLKSKQSRLTKKMKNASLSQKAFHRASGCIVDPNDAKAFAKLEEEFILSIQSQIERAEMRFHIQKEWRELFSSYCVAIGQPLDADAWLGSVEEMDRRASQARENARIAKRRAMMSNALTHDASNTDSGVFINRMHTGVADALSPDDLMSLLSGGRPPANGGDGVAAAVVASRRAPRTYDHGSPFLSKVIDYIQQNGVPFEHVDVWVPSFVPADGNAGGGASSETKCRLCFAGCATTEFKILPHASRTGFQQVKEGIKPPSEMLSPQEQVALFGFGEYSQKFSFNVGCGLPGRVYQSGIPTWEQSVHNAPHQHFERCGGAMQWGIKTVVGIPVPSPNVGRIVVVLYSCLDRPKDHDLVGQLCEELTKFNPEPKWKLVVDLGDPGIAVAQEQDELVEQEMATFSTTGGRQVSATAAATAAGAVPANNSNSEDDSRIAEIVILLGDHMPSDPSSAHSPYLSGFMSLRLLLLRSSRSPDEDEIIQTLLSSYSSYDSSGRTQSDIALMLARDFLFLKQHHEAQVAAVNQAQAIIPQNPSPLSPVEGPIAPANEGPVPNMQLGNAASGESGFMNGLFPSPALTPQQQMQLQQHAAQGGQAARDQKQ